MQFGINIAIWHHKIIHHEIIIFNSKYATIRYLTFKRHSKIEADSLNYRQVMNLLINICLLLSASVIIPTQTTVVSVEVYRQPLFPISIDSSRTFSFLRMILNYFSSTNFFRIYVMCDEFLCEQLGDITRNSSSCWTFAFRFCSTN